jgi:hypothetical protein
MGLEELRMHMVGIEDERATEAVGLSRLVMEITDALINVGLFPIRDIPWLPKSTQEVLALTGLILEQLQEERASNVGP